MIKYKEFLDSKISEVAKEKNILDLGGGRKFEKWLTPYKDQFKNSDFKSFDYDKESGADIIGDIHHLPFKDESVDAVICSSVLEHVEDPVRATSEIRRILKKNGKLFLYVPSVYPYHARKGHYEDYWRFFDDTLKFLFKDFSRVEIEKVGGIFKSLFFFIPYQHKMRAFLDPLADILDNIFRSNSATSGYYLYAIK